MGRRRYEHRRHTIRRKPTIESGETNETNAFNPADEWNGFPLNNFDGLGAHEVGPGDTAPMVESTTPANGAVVPATSNITIEFSEDVTVSGSWYALTCGGLERTATVGGGPRIWTLDPDSDLPQGTCAVAVFGDEVSDQDLNDPPDTMATNHGWGFTVCSAFEIHEIQGAAHTSPRAGQGVCTTGVVTAKRSNGYYMQDPTPDADDATSEGIFVFTGGPPSSVNVGDSVRAGGTVTEFRPGGRPTTT